MFDKAKMAEALTKTRLYGSPLVLAPLLVFGVWGVALGAAIVLILTDALDGYFARKANPNRSLAEQARGGKKDEDADGMLTNVILGGVAFNYVFVQNDFSWLLFGKVLLVLAVAGAVTITLMVATKKLPMPWCKLADILNAVYYGFLLTVAMVVIIGNMIQWNAQRMTVWGTILAIVVLMFCYAKRDRLFKRDNSKYERNQAKF